MSVDDPVNMPDPIRKRFGYGQLWPLRPACSQNQPGLYMSDPTSRVRFCFRFFPKKAWVVPCKTDPDGLVRVWPNTSGLLASLCAGIIWLGSGRTQPARYQFPTLRLGSVLPQTSRIILCKTSPGPI